MKKIILIAGILMIAIYMTGCKNNSLSGTYTADDVHFQKYIFYEDETGVIKNNDDEKNFTYKIDEKNLEIKIENEKYIFKNNGDFLSGESIFLFKNKNEAKKSREKYLKNTLQKFRGRYKFNQNEKVIPVVIDDEKIIFFHDGESEENTFYKFLIKNRNEIYLSFDEREDTYLYKFDNKLLKFENQKNNFSIEKISK